MPKQTIFRFKRYTEAFKRDLAKAKIGEKEVQKLLCLFLERAGFDVVKIEECNDYRYDLKFTVVNLYTWEWVEFTVEIKEDFRCGDTGNISVEYNCWNKPSGISISEADFYVYKAHEREGVVYYLMWAEDLKKLIEENVFHRQVVGGEKAAGALNYLFYIKDIRSISLWYTQEEKEAEENITFKFN